MSQLDFTGAARRQVEQADHDFAGLPFREHLAESLPGQSVLGAMSDWPRGDVVEDALDAHHAILGDPGLRSLQARWFGG